MWHVAVREARAGRNERENKVGDVAASETLRRQEGGSIRCLGKGE